MLSERMVIAYFKDKDHALYENVPIKFVDISELSIVTIPGYIIPEDIEEYLRSGQFKSVPCTHSQVYSVAQTAFPDAYVSKDEHTGEWIIHTNKNERNLDTLTDELQRFVDSELGSTDTDKLKNAARHLLADIHKSSD